MIGVLDEVLPGRETKRYGRINHDGRIAACDQ